MISIKQAANAIPALLSGINTRGDDAALLGANLLSKDQVTSAGA
ncbi:MULTISPECIES: hypothetical protein [Mesorhizobium]|nr:MULTISPECIES: hypothetical protein [Mesorhizobium]